MPPPSGSYLKASILLPKDVPFFCCLEITLVPVDDDCPIKIIPKLLHVTLKPGKRDGRGPRKIHVWEWRIVLLKEGCKFYRSERKTF